MKVAVIGAGIMGNGIAQVSAMANHDVALVDVGKEQLDRALGAIDTSLARFVKAGRLTAEAAAAARGRLKPFTNLTEAVASADVVVEAVPEVLELKHKILGAAAEAAPSHALLCTNTSQLSITRIATALKGAADRLAGTHFFNPPVMMRLVEIVRGEGTSDETLQRTCAFAESLGKEIVVCKKDSPGFITSRAIVALRLECMRMLEEGIAEPEDIDKALRLGFNFPMGMFELGDFNGLDTALFTSLSLLEAHGERFRPTITLRNMVAAGKLGRKTGEGFYKYDADGKRIKGR